METHTPRSLRDIHGVRPDARRRPRWRDALAGLLRSAWCAFARDRLRMRAARELARKDDRMLRDIGLNRADLRDAASVPLAHDPTDMLVLRATERRAATSLRRLKREPQRPVLHIVR